MDEDFFDSELIAYFERMVENQEHYYFDSDELEDIIGYYLDLGDLEYALIALEHAKSIHGDSPEIRIKELEYLLEINELHSATDMIEELKEVVGNHLDFIIAQARYWSLKGMHTLAIGFYEEALKQGEEEEDYILHCLGNECLDNNEVNRALYYFKSALELNAEDEMAFKACVDCFNQVHKHKDCIVFLEEYIELNPYAEFAWFELGVQYLTLKNYRKAYESFDYAVVINPKSINALMQMGHCMEQLNLYEKAIEIYKEASSFDDTAAFTFLRIGLAYTKIEDDFKALKFFLKAIHADPQLDKAWAEAAYIYTSLGNYTEAQYYLSRATELDATNILYLKQYAFATMQLGFWEEMEAIYKKILKLEPDIFLNWYAFAELLIVLDDLPKAMKVIKKAIDKFNKAESYYQLSNCLFLTNKKEEGVFYLKLAKQKQPELWSEMREKYPVFKSRELLGLVD